MIWNDLKIVPTAFISPHRNARLKDKTRYKSPYLDVIGPAVDGLDPQRQGLQSHS